jgi:hypothetical protein
MKPPGTCAKLVLLLGKRRLVSSHNLAIIPQG